MLATNATAPNPNRAPISRRLLAALMSGGNAMASVSNCAFVKLMQRQPDGAFVLAQRGGDLGDGCLTVALAPDPRGKLV
jgi:hypothetical protein